MKKFIAKYLDILKADFEEYQGLRLPKKRSNQGLSSNAVYLEETRNQLNFIEDCIPTDVRILDFGSGQGRLLNGLVHKQSSFAEYVGVDVDAESVAWCIRNLRYANNISFVWYNQLNSRYNKQGETLPHLPVKDGWFSFVFANSVFSHLSEQDVEKYARLLLQAADQKCRLYLTAFTEENVPNAQENPENYLQPGTSNSPLLRVRFNKDYFISMFEAAGWQLDTYRQSGISRTGQSELVFSVASDK